MRHVFLLAIVAALGACGPNHLLEVEQIDPKATPDTIAGIVAEEVPAGYSVIGDIEATDCKNLITDPEPTRERALTQLKLKAATLSASGVAAVTYDGEPMNLWKNCWASVTARGKAIKRDAPAPKARTQ